MISCSYANPTPWASRRELDEDALYDRMKGLADQLERPESAIFNLHVPPKASGLDTAFEIDDQLRIVVRNGKPHEIPVGSTAVRQLIEEYQPMLALHGHIHESRGAATIGRTLAINSGSEYATGRIHGVIVEPRRCVRAQSPVHDRIEEARSTWPNSPSDLKPPESPTQASSYAMQPGSCAGCHSVRASS